MFLLPAFLVLLDDFAAYPMVYLAAAGSSSTG